MAEASVFLTQLARRLGVQFRTIARKEVRSEAIERSLQVLDVGIGSVAVETPFYWARYYHDGRGAIQARPGHKLVYFLDPDKDPRILGRKYPVRESDIQPLRKKQFYRFLRDPSRGMVVTDSVGPAPGDPFFVRAERQFKRVAGRTAGVAISAQVREELKSLLDLRVTSVIVV